MKRLENNSCFLETLQTLPTEQLRKMLRQELDRSNKDKVLILEIWNILEHRHTYQPTPPTPQEEAAWARYQAAYAQSAEQALSQPPEKVRTPWLIKVAAAAAIVCLIVAFVPKAQGVQEVFEAIGRWTQELFGFHTDAPSQDYTFQTDNPHLQQVYDAVTAHGITDPVVPMWIPEGFELLEIKEFTVSNGNKVYARFNKGANYISFTYEFYEETKINKYVKEDLSVEEYEHGGTKYYLIANEEMRTAAWTAGKLECSIMTNLEQEKLCQIIKSINGR